MINKLEQVPKYSGGLRGAKKKQTYTANLLIAKNYKKQFMFQKPWVFNFCWKSPLFHFASVCSFCLCPWEFQILFSRMTRKSSCIIVLCYFPHSRTNNPCTESIWKLADIYSYNSCFSRPGRKCNNIGKNRTWFKGAALVSHAKL